MKQPILFIALITSSLALGAQNLTNVQMASVNYNNTQINQSINVNDNNVHVNNNPVQSNSSAFQNFNKSNKNSVKQQATTTKKKITNTNKTVVVSNIVNGGLTNVNDVNVGNVLDNNASENNVRSQSIAQVEFKPYRGNVFVKNDANINDNPVVVNDAPKTNINKPVVVEYQGLDFKPSGLSGRDYSNGGKLKKGEKNFYVAHKMKHKSVSKKKPSFKKVKHHTSKCASW